MTLHEELSRLLAGDLPEPEAAALRRRLATEPEVERAWQALQELVEAVQALPAEAPPPGLDARVLGLRTTERSPGRWGWALAGAAAGVLAGVLAAALLAKPHPPSRVALVRGQQVVSGRVQVVAGELEVEVDGLARLSVEPGAGLARAEGAQEDPMKTALSALAGAAGGALVTVAVLEGSALVRGPDVPPVRVEAGEVRTVGGSSRPRPQASAPDSAEVQRLQAEVERLTGELEEARLRSAVAQGQLVARVGSPQPWPTPAPAGLDPESLQARAREAVARHPGVALAGLDCSEYPCITLLQPTQRGEGWEELLKGAAQDLAEGLSGVGLALLASGYDDGDGPSGVMAAIVAPPDDLVRDTEVGLRTAARAEGLMEALVDEEGSRR